jgi:hypothetical protein
LVHDASFINQNESEIAPHCTKESNFKVKYGTLLAVESVMGHYHVKANIFEKFDPYKKLPEHQ